MLNIRDVTDEDHTDISVLLVSVFDQPTETKLVQQLRDDGVVAFEVLAEDEGGIVGYICLSHLQSPEGWLAIAPVATRTPNQNQGIGGELIRHALDRARQDHASAVVVVGSPEYYHRFGFVFNGLAELKTPYPSQYTGLFPIAAEVAFARATLVYPKAFENA